MKRIFNKFKTLLAAVLVVGAVGATGLALKSSESDALTIIRNCDPTAIIYCGATSVTELKNDYASRDGGRYPDIAAVYSYFGISASDIQNMGSTFKMGQVHKDGTVWLNGKQIGSGAVTAGRVNKPGSTAIPGTKAYARSTQVAFASDAIEAFIGFRNGSPAWAVLAGCGNPIKWNKPAIEIEKTVRNAANTAWVENDRSFGGIIPADAVSSARVPIRIFAIWIMCFCYARPRAFDVFGPTMPSADSPAERWNILTA
jgi:hypothetical protein